MIQLIVLLVSMVLILTLIDGIAAYTLGNANRGQMIISGLITIVILYVVLTTLFSAGYATSFGIGIPFVSEIDKNMTFSTLFHNYLGTFVVETAELISLIMLISFLEALLPVNNTNFSMMIISRLILVLVAVIANVLLVMAVQDNNIYKWALTCLQCLLSGASILVTPAMLVGSIVGLNPTNPVVIYVLKQLPNTALGKSIRTAVSRTAVLLFGIMAYESQYGPISGALYLGIELLYVIVPLVITGFGFAFVVKSALPGK